MRKDNRGMTLLSGILMASVLGSTDAYASVTVYDFFASWCGPCRDDIRRDNELQREYGGKVSFVGVNEDEDDTAANAFISSTSPSFSIIKDPTHSKAKSMGAMNKTPSVVIVSNGRTEVINGSISKSDLKAKIDAHLGR
jgi:thiol-disulfide isomerase/thioredoxin